MSADSRGSAAARHARHAHRAVPGRRSGRVGADRPPELAQGVQRRVQVRRQARRSRGPHAGHLPQDLQVAEHVRPPRELPDVAHQHQPQPLHRSLPERAQGAARRSTRDVDSRELPPASRERGPYAAARAARPRRAAARARSRRCPRRSDGRRPARHPGAVVPGDRRPARPARGHGQVAHQPRPHRAGAPDPAAAGQTAGASAQARRVPAQRSAR